MNKFSTTLSSGITASDTTIPLTNVPTPSEGFLVIEPDSATAWEVIYYTSKTGSGVVCPSVGAGRGQDDSNAASHSSGATVRMDTVAGMFESLQNGSAFGTNSIGAANLATNAITLGYAQITAVPTAVNSTTQAAVSGLSVTVTIPAGGRKVKITAYAPTLSNETVNGQSVMAIWDGTVGSGTQLTAVYAANNGNAGSGGAPGATAVAVVTPSAGSKTYNVGLAYITGSSAKINNVASTAPAFILVEAI